MRHISIAVIVGLLATTAILPQDKTKDMKKPAIDGEDAYKAHCTRCHIAIHSYPPRTMATVMNHMRVRANLTGDEAKAILQYLLETNESHTSTKRKNDKND
jgi:hypothetical protein